MRIAPAVAARSLRAFAQAQAPRSNKAKKVADSAAVRPLAPRASQSQRQRPTRQRRFRQQQESLRRVVHLSIPPGLRTSVTGKAHSSLVDNASMPRIAGVVAVPVHPVFVPDLAHRLKMERRAVDLCRRDRFTFLDVATTSWVIAMKT